MALMRLDHVNLRTADLDGMIAFYGDILGLRPGWRPPFDFPGAWLYCGDQPVVHLVGEAQPRAGGDPTLEHFALRGEGLSDFLAQLRNAGVTYWVRILPELGVRQVNVRDPDGNHIHIDFDKGEEADLSDYSGS